MSTRTRSPARQSQLASQRPAACKTPTGNGPLPLTSTTLTTIEQAYWCLFDHYVTGKTLDDRLLLNGAFSGLVEELLRAGLDQPTAMLPALTGDQQADWQAFSTVYQQVSAALPQEANLQQDVATATIQAMVQSLHNNHTRWIRPIPPSEEVRKQFPNGAIYGIGITTSADGVDASLPEARPPLFLIAIDPGSPAALQGLHPGDIISAVNSVAPFADDQLNPGVMSWLSPLPPQSDLVALTLLRPSTGQSWTVDLKPTAYAPPRYGVTARVLAGAIAYVHLPGFSPDAAALVIQAIQGLNLGSNLRGIILDLRSNGGGAPEGVAGLLGAFVHGKIYSYDINRDGKLLANYPDDTVPLLHQPLVVLTDRRCASACEAFTGAVRDLGLGKIVGTRTAGKVAGPADDYLLNDGSVLSIPSLRYVGAKGEQFDEIGVAPDYLVPLTPEAVSAGQDPDVEKAITVLG